MKYILLWAGLFFVALLSCTDSSAGEVPAVLKMDADTLVLKNSAGELDVKVTAGGKWQASTEENYDWCRYTVKNEKPGYLRIETDENKTVEERWATIVITSGKYKQNIRVCQLGIYKAAVPDHIAKDRKLSVKDGSASSVQPGEGIAKSFDGNMSTLYHSQWDNGAEDYFPVTLEYRFGTSQPRLDYLVYYPRTDGWNGRFKEVQISYKTQESPDYIPLGNYDFAGSALPTKIDFPGGVNHPAGVRFVVKSGTGDRQGFASCAEMEFYHRVETGTELGGIFTDETYSALKEEVTYEQIMAMDNEFLKNIARHLFVGTYPLADRVKEYEAYSDPDWIAGRYKINPYNRLDNATGIYVNAGDELLIFCKNPMNKKLGLAVMDWNNGYSGTNYVLLDGTNQIKMSSPGLVYVLYYDQDPATAAPVKLHIATGQINGTFVLNRDTDAEWSSLLNRSVAGYMDMQGEYTHMTMPVGSLRKIVSRPSGILQVYDHLVRLEYELMGLYKYKIPIKNRMFFHAVTGDAYMYATSYRTAYHVNTLPDILNTDKMRSGEHVWGPAHEVGHMNQTRPGLLWVGMTEVTNNIHSLNVQTTFGATSRLIAENMGGGVTRYEKAFTDMIGKQLPHNLEGDVFCKLVPFWQLQLYATRIAGKPDLYPDLHERVRNMTDPTDPDTKNGICQLNFVVQCCDILNEDLTGFFEAWGFLREIDKTIDDYGKSRMWVTAAQVRETRGRIARYPRQVLGGLMYLNDNNVGMFKANKPVIKGQVSREGNKITLTGWENVVAYELWEGGHMTLVRQKSEFTAPAGTDWSKAVIKAVAADGSRVSVGLN